MINSPLRLESTLQKGLREMVAQTLRRGSMARRLPSQFKRPLALWIALQLRNPMRRIGVEQLGQVALCQT